MVNSNSNAALTINPNPEGTPSRKCNFPGCYQLKLFGRSVCFDHQHGIFDDDDAPASTNVVAKSTPAPKMVERVSMATLIGSASNDSQPAIDVSFCIKCGTKTLRPEFALCVRCHKATLPVRPQPKPMAINPMRRQHDETMARSDLLALYCEDRLPESVSAVAQKGQIIITSNGKSYTFTDKGETIERQATKDRRGQMLNDRLVKAFRKGTLKASRAEEKGCKINVVIAGKEYALLDVDALGEAVKARREAEAAAARAEAEREAQLRAKHADLLAQYHDGSLADDVAVDMNGTKVTFLLEDGTELCFEDPALVAKADRQRAEAEAEDKRLRQEEADRVREAKRIADAKEKAERKANKNGKSSKSKSQK